MPLFIVRNDITKMKTDAIVNTANRLPIVGSGIDKAIYEKAGKDELLAFRQKTGIIEVGEAAVTPALGLPAQYIIHAVGPRWQGGSCGEIDLLAKCYHSILEAATAHNCASIAVPLISTGNFKFPRSLAMEIAKTIITDYLETHDLLVYLVVFDRSSYRLSEDRFREVQSYIDENYVDETAKWEYARQSSKARPADSREYAFCMKTEAMSSPVCAYAASEKNSKRSLADIVKELDKTFAEALFQHIDARGLTDPEVYKRANLDRKLFSKIRKSKDYKPSKNTALALAIALRLNLDETKDLIGKAGYALSRSSKADIIIEYFILQGEYDIFKLNEVLFDFDQPLLGSKVA